MYMKEIIFRFLKGKIYSFTRRQNFSSVQIEGICRRQFQYSFNDTVFLFSFICQKTLWEKEKLMVTRFLIFPQHCQKASLQGTVNSALCCKGLNALIAQVRLAPGSPRTLFKNFHVKISMDI